jgi:predicted transcriptional regulator
MARKRSPALTDGELRIMRVLWETGAATVGEVVEQIDHEPRPAYNTVLTMLRILEQKGYVAHEAQGRAFVFRALIGRREAQRSALSHVLKRFFDDSPEQLVLNLLGREDADPSELRRVRGMIQRAKTARSHSTIPKERR